MIVLINGKPVEIVWVPMLNREGLRWIAEQHRRARR